MWNRMSLWLHVYEISYRINLPDSKLHGANMGPTWGRQDPCGPHVGPMNLAIRAGNDHYGSLLQTEIKWDKVLD